ncbi:hypothetical protein EDD11_001656 [Mortierella claussenii]|nr:hypothetical protein EDD11_001656 [Mortierella claussenii]
MSVRKATHAGSWYSSKKQILDKELTKHLDDAGDVSSVGEPFPIVSLRAIIAPHAGYSYSGPAAGYAYKCIQSDLFKRIFILGPSHHVYLSGCAISKCPKYNTPLGDLVVDQEVNRALEKTGKFKYMSQETDEDEHSIEMHLPFVYKVFEHHQDKVTIIPILVGALTEPTEKQYGKLLAPYLSDPENLFIVSSDFCHWGQRFSYTYYKSNVEGSTFSPLLQREAIQRRQPISNGHVNSSAASDILNPPIHECIRKLDHDGMETIELQDHAAFCKYLNRTKNTICGRHPIGVLLAALEESRRTSKLNFKTRFVHYAQSSSVLAATESSVSYASAFVQLEQ